MKIIYDDFIYFDIVDLYDMMQLICCTDSNLHFKPHEIYLKQSNYYKKNVINVISLLFKTLYINFQI